MDYQVILIPHAPNSGLTEITMVVEAETGDDAVALASKPGYIVRGVYPAITAILEQEATNGSALPPVKPARSRGRAKAGA